VLPEAAAPEAPGGGTTLPTRPLAASPSSPATSPITLVAQALIWGYQHILSPVDGATCGFHPTCSAYGMQAVGKHGWLLGSLMALERIVRNHRAERTYPLVRVHGIVRLHDPVEDNDFWFDDEQ